MSVSMTLRYQGRLRTELVHGPSGNRIETDAPKDNLGRGEAFSPTDLVGAALLSCAVTTMAIRSAKEGVPFAGASGRVVKEMSETPPRRIARLEVEILLAGELTQEERATLEEFARTCPVALSISPAIDVEMRFRKG
jgi:uncharacterized OsmC-like protein